MTAEPAAIMGLEGYGLEPGCRADLVVLEAGDPIEAIRLKAARLFVLRAGQIVARCRAALGPARSAGPATRGELPACHAAVVGSRSFHRALTGPSRMTPFSFRSAAIRDS